nr:hypothetical protein [Shewanella sp. PS-2]
MLAVFSPLAGAANVACMGNRDGGISGTRTRQTQIAVFSTGATGLYYRGGEGQVSVE